MLPRSRRRKRSCVSGVPTSVTLARCRTSGICLSIASHSTVAASSFLRLYSALLRSRPSHLGGRCRRVRNLGRGGGCPRFGLSSSSERYITATLPLRPLIEL